VRAPKQGHPNSAAHVQGDKTIAGMPIKRGRSCCRPTKHSLCCIEACRKFACWGFAPQVCMLGVRKGIRDMLCTDASLPAPTSHSPAFLLTGACSPVEAPHDGNKLVGTEFLVRGSWWKGATPAERQTLYAGTPRPTSQQAFSCARLVLCALMRSWQQRAHRRSGLVASTHALERTAVCNALRSSACVNACVLSACCASISCVHACVCCMYDTLVHRAKWHVQQSAWRTTATTPSSSASVSPTLLALHTKLCRRESDLSSRASKTRPGIMVGAGVVGFGGRVWGVGCRVYGSGF
jgi:hypothetical protein